MSFICRNLSIKNRDKILLDISFENQKSYALIGQSGSGKSLTLKAFLGMLPSNLESSIQIECDYELRRGKTVSIVPQNPFTALSPLTKIKKQFFMPVDEIFKYIDMVGLDKELINRFPSELSGGQLQRVIIAMALSIRPKLLLLDEPTTALDKKSKTDILELIKKIQCIDNFDILFVTHDIATVRNLCDRVGILKEGRILEDGDIEDILKNPKNSYTRELIESGFENREFRE
ncbi:MAG: ATP-binding cassette domain-containing protein [Sulfurospirillum sp.]